MDKQLLRQNALNQYTKDVSAYKKAYTTPSHTAIPVALKDDKEFMLQAVVIDEHILTAASIDLTNDCQFMLKLIDLNTDALRYARHLCCQNTLNEYKEIVKCAVMKEWRNSKLVSNIITFTRSYDDDDEKVENYIYLFNTQTPSKFTSQYNYDVHEFIDVMIREQRRGRMKLHDILWRFV